MASALQKPVHNRSRELRYRSSRQIAAGLRRPASSVPVLEQRFANLQCAAEDGRSDSGAVDIPVVQPRLSYVLLAMNLAVYAAGITIALTAGNDASNDFFLSLAKDNANVAAGEWWRLLTANFLHAGVLHLALNSAALYAVAPEAEAALGYGTFLTIYLLSGVSGSVASFVLDDLVTVGASGAIFGLLGALAAYFVRNPTLQRSWQQLLYITGVLGLNVVLGLDGGGMVDNTGHIAGLLAGLSLGLVMSPSYALVHDNSPQSVPDTNARSSGDSSTGADDNVAAPVKQEATADVVTETGVQSSSDVDMEPSGKVVSALEASLARLSQLSVEEPVATVNVSERLAKLPDVQVSVPRVVVPRMVAVDQTSNTVRILAAASFSVSLAVATWAGVLAQSAPPQ